MSLHLVRELHDEDAVLRDETHERYEADLRVDVERRGPAIREACAAYREQGSIGDDSFGVARPLPNNPDPFTCQ